ncbi:MAG: hypothetical protein OEW87_09895, partial [Flavobacteriaceae bacterium]|nr:hypothetical protein [Flavobacteriaceae bacterium]
MGASNQTVLRFLDHSIGDIDEFETISRTVARISRCKEAVEAGNNLADILDDAKNIKSLEGIFGKEFDIGMQILTKVSLNDYKSSSFTINKEIVGHKKFD